MPLDTLKHKDNMFIGLVEVSLFSYIIHYMCGNPLHILTTEYWLVKELLYSQTFPQRVSFQISDVIIAGLVTP